MCEAVRGKPASSLAAVGAAVGVYSSSLNPERPDDPVVPFDLLLDAAEVKVTAMRFALPVVVNDSGSPDFPL